MNLSFFIARRIAHADTEQKLGVMERIAVISVALSMTVMILSIAIIMGFKQQIKQKMTGFSAPVTLTSIQATTSSQSVPILRTPHLEELIASLPSFRNASPYTLKGGIVRTHDAVEGVLLKGVSPQYPFALFEKWLVEGQLPRLDDSLRHKDLLLSQTLAQKLQVELGDYVEILFIEANAQPRRDRFQLRGIYSSGMEEMDRMMLLTDIRNVQRLSDWTEDQVSGYEILLDDADEAARYAQRLNHALFMDESEHTLNLKATSMEQNYPNIFDWLKAHDINAAVILVIMLLVAFFNMASSLLILVLERTRMIGLMKVMGMPNGQLRTIFLYRAAMVARRGLIWGNALGVGLCLIQHKTHWLKLSSEGYLLSEVPIALDWGWWLMLNVGFCLSILLLMMLPASIITKIKPAESIRYE